MNIDLDNLHEHVHIKETLEAMLRVDAGNRSELAQMWHLMDLIWDEYKCDNVNYNWTQIERFYTHPVWLLNGLFIEQDKVSMQHRHAISDFIVGKKTKEPHRLKLVVDYGGGIRYISQTNSRKGLLD